MLFVKLCLFHVYNSLVASTASNSNFVRNIFKISIIMEVIQCNLKHNLFVEMMTQSSSKLKLSSS